MENMTHSSNLGEVVSVHGSVVDIRFAARLPPIHSLLRAGAQGRIVIEVLAQRDARHVRGIALTPVQGLARGMSAQDTGGPLKAPVGRAILSRMFDLFGNAIDREGALSDVQWRSVHRAPPALARRSTRSEVFEPGSRSSAKMSTPLPAARPADEFYPPEHSDRLGHTSPRPTTVSGVTVVKTRVRCSCW